MPVSCGNIWKRDTGTIRSGERRSAFIGLEAETILCIHPLSIPNTHKYSMRMLVNIGISESSDDDGDDNDDDNDCFEH